MSFLARLRGIHLLGRPYRRVRLTIDHSNPTMDKVPRPIAAGGNPHGKVSSWILVGVVVAAFLVGGISLITGTVWLTIACAVVVVLSVPVGAMIHIMSDTVGWAGAPPTTVRPLNTTREAVRINEIHRARVAARARDNRTAARAGDTRIAARVGDNGRR